MLLWVKSPCGLVGKSRRFGETYCLHLKPWKWRQHASPKRSCFLSKISNAYQFSSKLTSCSCQKNFPLQYPHIKLKGSHIHFDLPQSRCSNLPTFLPFHRLYCISQRQNTSFRKLQIVWNEQTAVFYKVISRYLIKLTLERGPSEIEALQLLSRQQHAV
jgi:hypothetical protein